METYGRREETDGGVFRALTQKQIVAIVMTKTSSAQSSSSAVVRKKHGNRLLAKNTWLILSRRSGSKRTSDDLYHPMVKNAEKNFVSRLLAAAFKAKSQGRKTIGLSDVDFACRQSDRRLYGFVKETIASKKTKKNEEEKKTSETKTS